jgi:hypothetical protein
VFETVILALALISTFLRRRSLSPLSSRNLGLGVHHRCLNRLPFQSGLSPRPLPASYDSLLGSSSLSQQSFVKLGYSSRSHYDLVFHTCDAPLKKNHLRPRTVDYPHTPLSVPTYLRPLAFCPHVQRAYFYDLSTTTSIAETIVEAGNLTAAWFAWAGLFLATWMPRLRSLRLQDVLESRTVLEASPRWKRSGEAVSLQFTKRCMS